MAAVASDREQPDRGRPQEREPLPNPVARFDYYLKVLDTSYIQFFQERIRIEEQYIESLSLLFRRTLQVDSQLDNGIETTTLRQAWREARDCVDREARTHEAFVSALKVDVVMPLIDLKETTERTRKRIKEDIKDSTQWHVDYAETQLPRLKRKYFRKIQDVEDYKASEKNSMLPSGFAPIPQAFSPPSPAESTSTSPTSTHFQTSLPNPIVGGPGASPPRQPPTAAPQPHQVTSSNPLGGQPSRLTTLPGVPLYRSLTASTYISEIAFPGRRALRGMLADGSNRPVLNALRDNFSDKNNQTMRTVKAKRDAEDADNEYRKGVHWLETLRLRRAKTIRSGYTSLEDFLWEQGATVQSVLQKYTDSLLATAATTSQLVVHVQSGITRVSLEKDRTIQVQPFLNVDTALQHALPPTLYHNYSVGESKDLIFGNSLAGYATSRGITGEPGVALFMAGMAEVGGRDGGGHRMSREERRGIGPIGLAQETVPRLVRLCIQYIDSRGLDVEGIYRESGRLENVQELRHLVEKDESEFRFDPQKDDVFCVCSLLKQYLGELSEPVFRLPIVERIQLTEEREKHIQNGFKVLRSKMRRLPPVHQATLRLLIEHLARVVAHRDRNNMDPKNLSIVFDGLLFGDDDMSKDGSVLLVAHTKDTVLEDMIAYANKLFDEPQLMSPPLPPVAMEEPVLVDYGTSYTRVYERPKRPERDQDFVPALPSRPDHSIHPGIRRTPSGSASSSSPPQPSPGTVESSLEAADTSDDGPPPSPPPAGGLDARL
ncbi:hypothetical protein FRC04_000348 [Tulasnella sp. 424]|nr:hypothetical protein FRC04_000348 [Tulasnella sp. 424]KAG8973306.1 hypothetical protein FRC05_008850 [Tulasnella sp. 425]